MDTLVNVNPNISIVGNWIFDSKYLKSLCLTKYSLDIVCSYSVCEEQVEKLESVFYAVIYMWAPINHKIG